MDPKAADHLKVIQDAQTKHKSQAPATKEDDVLTYNEARKYFAGCALTGMLSECRLGNSLSKAQMEEVCRRADYMGTTLADMMC